MASAGQAATQAGGVVRDLEIGAVILSRASRQLAEAWPQTSGERQQQAQQRIESMRRELERITERIGKERGSQTC